MKLLLGGLALTALASVALFEPPPSESRTIAVGLDPAVVARLAYDAGFREWDLVIAVAVAGAESHWRPGAMGDLALQDLVWGPSVGLWQVRSLWDQQGTEGVRDLLGLTDPATNARSAFAIASSPRGWDHWTMYRNGRWLDWLDVSIQATATLRAGPLPPHLPTLAP